MSNLMKIIGLLLRREKGDRSATWVIAIVLVAGVASGAAGTALIVLISDALTRPGQLTARDLWLFGALCVALPISRYFSSTSLIRLAQGVVYDLRVKLSRRILAAPLRSLEELGPPRLLASLTDDTSVIADFFVNVPIAAINLSVVLGCLGYIAWLSWQACLLILGVVAFGVVTYRLAIGRGTAHFRKMREHWDQLFNHFRGLTDGTKELKIHGGRRSAFLDRLLEPAAAAVRRNFIAGTRVFAVANSWGQVLSFLLIAALFALYLGGVVPTPQRLTRLVMIFLYMRAPIEAMVLVLPNLNRAAIAAQRLTGLGVTLENLRRDAVESTAQATRWHELRLAHVTHVYRREDADENFTLGPIDLAFAPGELIFIVGGNGSGKTTLAKLILGLYVPESGEVRLDGEVVDDERRNHYLSLFSTVFSDFYLFDKLLGVDVIPGVDERARHYLRTLHLSEKVKVEDGALSTVKLSQGQRKRLALLTAYLEDRPVYLFDEWAADQDPEFKEIFYRSLLPELRERGKTVLVISHDDRYYPLADRLIKLESGKIVFDGAPLDAPSIGVKTA